MGDLANPKSAILSLASSPHVVSKRFCGLMSPANDKTQAALCVESFQETKYPSSAYRFSSGNDLCVQTMKHFLLWLFRRLSISSHEAKETLSQPYSQNTNGIPNRRNPEGWRWICCGESGAWTTETRDPRPEDSIDVVNSGENLRACLETSLDRARDDISRAHARASRGGLDGSSQTLSIVATRI